MVGGGIREPPDALELFGRVVNLVRKHAPQAAIAFSASRADSASPADSADAAARILAVG